MAELKHYRLVGPDGSIQYRSVPADALPPRWEPGAPRPVQVPRLPDDFEDWDAEAGRFVANAGARADAEAGAAAIARAHARKAIEAMMINSGFSVQGMLSAEAAALGIPLRTLAAQVDNKAREEVQAEITRRIEKKKGSM